MTRRPKTRALGAIRETSKDLRCDHRHVAGCDCGSTPEHALTVREACRKGRPLGGADAQALEHALTMTERERDELRAANDDEGLVHALQASLARKGVKGAISKHVARLTKPSKVGAWKGQRRVSLSRPGMIVATDADAIRVSKTARCPKAMQQSIVRSIRRVLVSTGAPLYIAAIEVRASRPKRKS